MISDDDVSDDKCRKMASENYAGLYGNMLISFAANRPKTMTTNSNLNLNSI